jgi:hypothetical protein
MSRVNLALGCLYGFRGDVDAVERAPGREARVGSYTHSLVEHHLGGPIPATEGYGLDEIDAANRIANGPLREWLRSYQWTAVELGVRYDAATDTAAEGPRRGAPGYEDVPAMTLPGTLDLVIRGDSMAYVYDVKTGKPPADSEQLYAQAVAVSRLYDVSTVHVAYARALKTKFELLSKETLNADALDYHAGRIRRLLRQLPVSQPTPGDEYCWKCNARSSCPAFGAERARRDADALQEAGFFGG